MWKIIKGLKRKIKKRQSGVKGYGLGHLGYVESFVRFVVLTALGMLTSFAILAFTLLPFCLRLPWWQSSRAQL
ncbi:MAG: hypothetical protein N3B10_11530 [Armatimonadetes bacterium]|nr:hypothetical protein [Armatimonadota bacterium]